MQSLNTHRDILVLGGGDGLALREVLKYNDVRSITLVDLDKTMTELFSTHPSLISLNKHSLANPKVKIFHEDAFQWLKKYNRTYDFVIVDFPDPSTYSIGKLYSVSFYELLKKHIKEDGIAVIQSTSPYAAPMSFWCINNTLKSCGLRTTPYHVYVPSFGEWGFVLASHKDFIIPESFTVETKYLNKATLQQAMVFPNDMISKTQEVNRLNNQSLVRLFEEEWGNYLQ